MRAELETAQFAGLQIGGSSGVPDSQGIDVLGNAAQHSTVSEQLP
jgi:hypothetical protein